MVHARDGGVLDAAPGPVESLLVLPHAQHGLAQEEVEGEAVMRVRLREGSASLGTSPSESLYGWCVCECGVCVCSLYGWCVCEA